jgi:hypothetical protein
MVTGATGQPGRRVRPTAGPTVRQSDGRGPAQIPQNRTAGTRALETAVKLPRATPLDAQVYVI